MIKSTLKKEIIDYYDLIKSEIDIKSQEILSNPSFNDEKKEALFDIYLKMIKECEQLFEKNIEEINNYFEQNVEADLLTNLDIEDIKTNILSGYCSFIRSNLLKDQMKLNNKIGILFITDWYLDKNQLNYLK